MDDPKAQFPSEDQEESGSFWAGMDASEHFVHLYRDESSLLDLLTRFVADGLRGGEAAIVIATPEHLAALDRRINAHGIDLVAARWQGQFLPIEARAALRQFMLPTGPDPDQFARVMGEVLARARRKGRKVRAFGEMVSLLWADGRAGATIELERLWNQFCEREALPLFCAYPQAAFDDASSAALSEICRAHSRLIAA